MSDLQTEIQNLKANHDKQINDLNSNLDGLKKKKNSDAKNLEVEIKNKVILLLLFS